MSVASRQSGAGSAKRVLRWGSRAGTRGLSWVIRDTRRGQTRRPSSKGAHRAGGGQGQAGACWSSGLGRRGRLLRVPRLRSRL
eukprot:12927855-Heterocapsa_arctica.AAC.1